MLVEVVRTDTVAGDPTALVPTGITLMFVAPLRAAVTVEFEETPRGHSSILPSESILRAQAKVPPEVVASVPPTINSHFSSDRQKRGNHIGRSGRSSARQCFLYCLISRGKDLVSPLKQRNLHQKLGSL